MVQFTVKGEVVGRVRAMENVPVSCPCSAALGSGAVTVTAIGPVSLSAIIIVATVGGTGELGRASCRVRVKISVAAVSLKKMGVTVTVTEAAPAGIVTGQNGAIV